MEGAKNGGHSIICARNTIWKLNSRNWSIIFHRVSLKLENNPIRLSLGEKHECKKSCFALDHENIDRISWTPARKTRKIKEPITNLVQKTKSEGLAKNSKLMLTYIEIYWSFVNSLSRLSSSWHWHSSTCLHCELFKAGGK